MILYFLLVLLKCGGGVEIGVFETNVYLSVQSSIPHNSSPSRVMGGIRVGFASFPTAMNLGYGGENRGIQGLYCCGTYNFPTFIWKQGGGCMGKIKPTLGLGYLRGAEVENGMITKKYTNWIFVQGGLLFPIITTAKGAQLAEWSLLWKGYKLCSENMGVPVISVGFSFYPFWWGFVQEQEEP
ncbi:MAG: hypothetical protein ABIN54_07350 [candidate division WOR-3 bacterium]